MRKKMKKLLLATTMLVGTAGFAAAEVTLSGDARMGIINDGDQTEFTSRARVAFGLSGETDGGLSFGASFRADNSEAASKGNAGSVFISGAFGKISMGDVDSADKAAVGQISGVGMTGLDDANEVEYSADGVGLFGAVDYYVANADVSSKVLYSYTADAISIYASLSQIAHDEDEDAGSYALGASYSAGDLTIAAGYGHVDATDAYGPIDAEVTDFTMAATYVLGATTFKGLYQNKHLDLDGEKVGEAQSYGVSVDHAIDALTLTGFAIATDVDVEGESAGTLHRYGLGASYALGGGASIVGGVSRADSFDWDAEEVVGNTQYDLGVSFSF
jgi:outer membrane protein OmpU